MNQLSMFAEPVTAAKRPPVVLESGAVKGCSIIYAPKGQAGEYAKLATNPYRGCGHKCSYCYVPLVLKMKRPEFDAGATPRPDFIKKLRKDAAKYQAAGIHEQVLLSFTTDPYCPDDVEHQLTRKTIEILQAHGLAVMTLTKGGRRALRDIDLFRPGIDAFATTLTSLDDEVSMQWEAGAALPQDRIDTLRRFHERGIYTWVSLEPVYDTEATKQIIRETHEFVDLYKVGQINYHKLTKATDWQRFTDEVVGLMDSLGQDYYIKNDLRPYLR